MPSQIATHLLVFVVSVTMAVAVIAVNWWVYEFWSTRVMYFPDEWMKVFPRSYSGLFDLALYSSYVVTAIAAGLVLGIAFGKRAVTTAILACILVGAGYWLLLLASIYGLVFEVQTFWLPMACSLE
jgi:hypothetical protein